jgi:pimeloyl-ACP methyl ester carboxylesterase
MPSSPSKTIVFITGAFVSNSCWDEWKAYFESKGYTCYAPAHPNKDASAVALRGQHPHSAIAANRLTAVVDSYAQFIKGLPEKPILVGHSFGGLMVQLLLQRDLAVAGVAIHSVPPQGVISFKWSFIRAVTPALGLFTSADKTYLMTFKQWQYAFTNGMPLSVQQTSYEELVVPESKRMARGGLSSEAKIDFKRPHVPLLFVAGSTDHIMPASLNHSNYQRYKKHAHSQTDYKEFVGRNHFVLGQPTWREDADYVLAWLSTTVGAQAPAPSVSGTSRD